MISFLAASYGTVSDIEVLFTLLSVVGAGFSLFSSIEGWKDLKAIESAGIGNGRRLLAWSSLHAEIGRFFILLIFLALGIMAMFIPDMPQTGLPTLIIVFGSLFRWGLIISTAILMYKSGLTYYVRKHLREERISLQNGDEYKHDEDPLVQPLTTPDSPPQ